MLLLLLLLFARVGYILVDGGNVLVMGTFSIKVQVHVFLSDESFASGHLGAQQRLDIDPVHGGFLQMPLKDFIDDVVPRILGAIDVLFFELIVADASHHTNVRSQLAVEARALQAHKTRQDLAAQGKVLLGLDKGDPGRTGFGTIRTDLVAGDSYNSCQTLLALDRFVFGFGLHTTTRTIVLLLLL